MRPLMKELLGVWAVLLVLFLVLTHFTGFERDIRALAVGGVDFTKALQGR